MKLQILSDLHLETGDYKPERTAADVVILAGDIKESGLGGIRWAKQNFKDKPVIYVMGNHEYYNHSVPTLLMDAEAATETGNICFLENKSIEINGWTFLGCSLWTDFIMPPFRPAATMLVAQQGMADFYKIRIKGALITPLDTVKMHYASLKWLKEEPGKHNPKKTVVVTHHAPSRMSLSPYHVNSGSLLNAAFASVLGGFVRQSGIPLWVNGHTHYNADYKLGKTRVYSNQRGYANHLCQAFNPTEVIDLG